MEAEDKISSRLSNQQTYFLIKEIIFADKLGTLEPNFSLNDTNILDNDSNLEDIMKNANNTSQIIRDYNYLN